MMSASATQGGHKNRDAQKKRSSNKVRVLRPERRLWWERFETEVGLELGVKERGSYGWWEWWVERVRRVAGAWTGKSKTEGLEWGWRRELGSWFQRHGEAYRKEWSIIRNDDDSGGRAWVTRDEERVLRKMRLCRYGGWVVVTCEDFVSEWQEFVFDAFILLFWAT